MAHADTGAVAMLHIEVACSPARGVMQRVALRMPAGSTLADAIAASGLAPAPCSRAALGIWGKVTAPETLLRDGDRVELYRALAVDPKEARRLRYQRAAKVRTAGRKG